ncbi:putative hydrolase of the HAD superfamily [Paraoerskovia marina]|uniref:Putative hydrolase of the HAD superfamily n=1 Tax=Paraoerskovia marina TaxID=545619 RepID=A0A1H1NXM8_9CELL|nr:HAD family hydrolase [Paraoerskovia marina]SDS03738.1 putative hydrolase of the HAD superfamily [Paraoerskovia marina]
MTREQASTALPGTDDVRAVSFDIWLTLVRSNPDFKRARAAAFHEVLGLTGPVDDFAATLREADRRTDRECERTGVDLDVRHRVGAALVAAGRSDVVDAPTVRRLLEAQDALVEAHPPRAMHPGLAEGLAALSARVPLAVTSNTGMIPGVTMRRVLARLGLLDPFVVTTFSDEVGRAKPDPAIFRATVDALGVPASTVLHVGDNPEADVAGATAAGLVPCLVDSPESVHAVVQNLVAARAEGAA